MSKKIRMLRTEQGYIGGIHLKNFEKGVIYVVGLGIGGIDQALADVFVEKHDKRGPAAEWVNEEVKIEDVAEIVETEEKTEKPKEETKAIEEAPQKQADEKAPEVKKDEKEDRKPVRTRKPKGKSEKDEKDSKEPDESKKDEYDPTSDSVWLMMSADEFFKHVNKYAKEFNEAETHIKVKAKSKWERLCSNIVCPID